MLSNSNYNKGIAIHEQIKYNIHYNKHPMFDIVCAGMADKLLKHKYNSNLTEEQREALNKITSK